MDAHYKEIVIKLLLSLLIGLFIGAEREYRNKSAGLRTIILICIGSTLFTITSIEISHPTEIARIASNIVTGIGFLGAGAILRDGLSVSGLTTASTIWVAAALGMAVGAGEYAMAVTAAVIVLIVLTAFNYLQHILDRLHRNMDLYVVFDIEENSIHEVEEKMQSLDLRFERKKERREQGDVTYQYDLSGSAKKLQFLIEYLIAQKEKVKSFRY